MIDFETAKRIALEYGRKEVFFDSILCEGSELKNCWIFNFATSEKCYIPDVTVRVLKDDGKCDSVSTIDDPDLTKEYREGKAKRMQSLLTVQ